MSFFNKLKTAMQRAAEIILDIDETSLPKDQMNLLYDYLSKHRFNTETEDLQKLVKMLKKKHLVDSICVANNNGSVIVSSNGNSFNTAITGTAMFNYIQSEMPKSETVLIKSNKWHMLMPYNNKVYIIEAGSNLSTIELKAIAKEVEEFLSKKNEMEFATQLEGIKDG